MKKKKNRQVKLAKAPVKEPRDTDQSKAVVVTSSKNQSDPEHLKNWAQAILAAIQILKIFLDLV